MTDSLRHINPPTLTNSLVVGYSQVVAARGQMVFIAGQVGWDATGKMATGFDAEVRQALENVKLALAAAGATTKHVTSSSLLSRRADPRTHRDAVESPSRCLNVGLDKTPGRDAGWRREAGTTRIQY